MFISQTVVEQIKVKVFHPAPLELCLKDFFYLIHVGQVVAGELVRQIKAVPGVPAQCFAQGGFGIAVVITPGGVKVVDALFDGVVYHLFHGGLVDLAVLSPSSTGRRMAPSPKQRGTGLENRDAAL